MGTAFVALTVVLIVFQPGSPRNAANAPVQEASVTRVAPSLDALSTPAVAEAAPTAQSPAGAALVSPQTVPGDVVPSSVRDLTFGAISNLKSATTGETPAPGEPGSFLHSVVQRSLDASASQQSAVQPEPVSQSLARQPRARSYFVRPGDTLISIAQEVYGDPQMATALYESNAHILAGPDTLRAGMVLGLPTR